MSQLQYGEARATILEHTELGYTLASQDKLWTCFVFDTWSKDELRGNRLFFRNEDRVLSYDMWDEELVWTTRAEADAFRDAKQAQFDNEHTSDRERIVVYTINWGDDSRWERSVIEDRVGILEGKFAGSRDALVAMTAQWDALK